ncbi:MAG: hypothetical protein M1133_12640 [Armatimonadetes bacterium]|nr:hypothetical protein [Armatimonadota bacterium]
MSLHSFHTPRFRLDIEIDDTVRRISLTDVYSNVAFADGEYRYSAFVEYDGKMARLEDLHDATLSEEYPDRGGKIVTISGYLGGSTADARVNVRHRLFVSEDEEFVEELILLRNEGTKDVILRGYRFGFRKRLEKPEKYGGPGTDIENYRLIALPFRLQPDGTKHDYQLDDIYHGRYQASEFYNPARLVQEVVDKGRARSEGWAWTDGENGLLITKYNPLSVEYSMLDTERREDGVYLSFGGASASLYNEPVEARVIKAGGDFTFGLTRFHFYEGLWRRGAYMFRDHMAGLGHGLPDDFSPPLHWVTQYNIGWHHNDPAKLAEHYTLDAMESEARLASELGCEALMLGPGWEECEGGTTWDTERLGEPKDFVAKMKDEYGLGVGFRTVGRSYCDEYHGMYRRRSDGSFGYYAPYHPNPFHEPCLCSAQYQEEKLRRILNIIDAGMRFISFDEFDWRGPCHDPNHGHAVPTTPNMHANAVTELICKLREKRPDIEIEAHDPVWPWGIRYLPVYYLYDSVDSPNEIWAFDFMWNPLENLLSGRALSLFYYNLAYDIPLYLHIPMDSDNDNCLAFWWYASTVRHLGLGGGKSNPSRREAYKAAIEKYKSLRDLYARGEFHAIDELTHIHVLPDSGRCVVNAFNLIDTPMSRTVDIRLSELGLVEDVEVDGAPYQLKGDKLTLQLDIPPFSPAVISVAFKLGG